MTTGAIILGVILVVVQLTLPRKWAFAPLLFAAAHTSQTEALGDLTTVRLVLITGILRGLVATPKLLIRRAPLDLPFLAFFLVAIVSSFAHSADADNPLKFRLGFAGSILFTYGYCKLLLPERDLYKQIALVLVLALTPLAALLAIEQRTGKNLYSAVGAKREDTLNRAGRNRAMGPFGTPILAGTVGAVAFPLFLPLFRTRRTVGLIGAASAVVIVGASASSGPIGTLAIGTFGAAVWKWRRHLRLGMVAGALLLSAYPILKGKGPWHVLTSIDLVGGSTGWHRAKLIDNAFLHFGEWWFAGTDYTAHWMPYRLPQNPNHCDLTNYFIHIGVIGGVPLLVCLLWIVYRSFKLLNNQSSSQAGDSDLFQVWCSTCALAAFCISALTISYYDQVYVFFYLLISATQVIPISARTSSQLAPVPQTRTSLPFIR